MNLLIKRLREKNEARTCINNLDEVMLNYYQVFAREIKPLPPEPQLPDVYIPPEGQQNGELIFATVVTGLATYAICNYLK